MPSYWNREIESETVFGVPIAMGDGERYLRTGDLGFLHEENLFVIGREKDLIIFAGQNYYSSDIESVVEDNIEGFRSGCVAAFAAEGQEGDRLVIVAEVDRRRAKSALDEVAGSLRTLVVDEVGIEVSDILLYGLDRSQRLQAEKFSGVNVDGNIVRMIFRLSSVIELKKQAMRRRNHGSRIFLSRPLRSYRFRKRRKLLLRQ